MKDESISVLADNQLSSEKVDEILGALNKDEREAWAIYHLIGDVMRAQDLSLTPSSDFSSRLAARLEAEPALVPVATLPRSEPEAEALESEPFLHHLFSTKLDVRRLIPGVAAISAVTAAGVFAVPHLMVASNAPRISRESERVPLALVSKQGMVVKPVAGAADGLSSQPVLVTAAANLPVTKRPVTPERELDSYLVAHQQMSPSASASAQYVRSSIFAAESEK